MYWELMGKLIFIGDQFMKEMKFGDEMERDGRQRFRDSGQGWFFRVKLDLGLSDGMSQVREEKGKDI